jgi:hypothetical protein
MSEEDREYDGLGPLNRFFGTTWDQTVKKYRWPIILFGLAFAGFSLYRASQISKLTQPEDFLPREYYINVCYVWVMNNFPAGGSAGYIIASVILGLDYLDRSEVN